MLLSPPSAAPHSCLCPRHSSSWVSTARGTQHPRAAPGATARWLVAFSTWSPDPARHCGRAVLSGTNSSPGPARAVPTHRASEICAELMAWLLGALLGTDVHLPGRVASVAATLLDDHVLVVSDDDLTPLVVEHGQGAHLDWGAGRTRHQVGLVEPQQTL